jgi:hypothetical protein
MKKNTFNGLLAAAIVVLVGLACNNYGTKLEFNKGEVYYTSNSNEADARKLGDFLVKEKYFNGTPKTVQLDKSGSTNQVRMVIQADKQNDPEILAALKTFAGQMSEEVFDKAPTEIHVTDDSLKTVKVVTP